MAYAENLAHRGEKKKKTTELELQGGSTAEFTN